MKKILKFSFLACLIMLFLQSCDEVEDMEVGGTSTKEMAGDWYVKLVKNNQDVKDYYLLTTYNTSANDGKTLWIDDHEEWPMKVKAVVDVNSLSLSGTDLENLYSYDDNGVNVAPKVTIREGKIVKGGAVTPGGNKSDLIVLTVEFSDDAGEVYTITGYKRTGFAADEH